MTSPLPPCCHPKMQVLTVVHEHYTVKSNIKLRTSIWNFFLLKIIVYENSSWNIKIILYEIQNHLILWKLANGMKSKSPISDGQNLLFFLNFWLRFLNQISNYEKYIFLVFFEFWEFSPSMWRSLISILTGRFCPSEIFRDSTGQG